MAKEPSKKELYDSAIKKDKEPWNPGEKLMEFVASKTGADKPVPPTPPKGLKKGGKADCGCKKMAKGGYVKAADGIATRGKTRGKMV